MGCDLVNVRQFNNNNKKKESKEVLQTNITTNNITESNLLFSLVTDAVPCLSALLANKVQRSASTMLPS